MEIGLTAKVSPEVNEREAEKQASLLEGHMEQAVQDLEAGVEMDDVVARVSDMNDHVEGLSEHTTTASENFSEMEESLGNFDTGVLEELSGGDFGMDVLFGDGPAMMGGGEEQQEPSMMQSAVGGITNMASGGLDQMNEQLGALGSSLRDQSVFMSRRLAQASSIRGILGSLGRTFSKTGGKVALAGIGLILLSRIASKMVEQSPLLGTVTDILGQALGLFFRPFGNIIGRLLLPIATNMIRLAANFNRVFGERGIIAALLFLGEYIVRGLASTGETAGRKLVFGNDGNFGVADALRVGILGAIGKKLFFKVLSASLPKITTKALLNVFTGGLGGNIANYILKQFGIEALEKNLTKAVPKGIKNILGKITPSFIKEPIKRLFTSVRGFSLVGAITSRLPSISARGLLSGLMARIPSIGVKSILAKLIPSAGKGLLASIGLKGLLAGLGGRLAYAIPVVGQIIGLLDLLVMAITFLIPGMETFSPIMYTLTKLFELGVFLFTGLLDALRGLWDWLTGITLDSLMPDISLGSLMPDISLGGLTEGGFSGLVEKIDEVVSSLMYYIGPILEMFKLPIALLAPFALLGIELFNYLNGITFEDIVNFLEKLKDKITDFGGNLIGKAKEKLKNVASDIRTAGENLFNSVKDGAEDFVSDVIEGAKDTADEFIESAEDFASDVKQTATDLKNDVTGAASDLKEDVTNAATNLEEDVISAASDMKDDVTSAATTMKNDVVGAAVDIKDKVTSAATTMKNDVVGAASDMKDDVTNAATSIKNDVTNAGRDIKNDVTSAASDFLSDIQTSASGFLSDIQSSATDLASDVRNSASDLKDDVVNAAQGLKNDVETAATDFINSVSIDDFEDYVSGSISDLGNYVDSGIGSLSGYVDSGLGSLSDYIDSGLDAASDIIDFPDIDLIDYISTPNLGQFSISDYIDAPSLDTYSIANYIDPPSFDTYDIASYIDTPSFGEFEIEDYLDVPGFGDINISESAFDIPNIGIDEYDFDISDIDLNDYINISDIDLDQYDFDTNIELDEYDFEIPEIKFEDAGDSLIPDFEFGSGGVVKSATNAVVGEAGPEVILPFDKVPGFTANILQGDAIGDAIPGLATGGVVTEPTTAVVGEGTESEAVLPLSRLESLIQTPSEPDIGNTTTIEVNVEGGDSQAFSGNDDESLASAIASALSSEFKDLQVTMNDVKKEIRRLRRNQRATIEADGKTIAEISEENKDRYKRSRNITK